MGKMKRKNIFAPRQSTSRVGNRYRPDLVKGTKKVGQVIPVAKVISGLARTFSKAAGAIATVYASSAFEAARGYFVYAKVGTWPTWAVLDVQFGTITGTPNETVVPATYSGLQVRATSSAGTVLCNPFTWTVTA